MKHFKLSLLTLGVVSSLISVEVSAAGLGRMNIYSGLGQPLNAEIEIIANPQELQTMSAQLASPTAFANAGIQFADALRNNHIYFQIVKKKNGKSVLKLKSNQAFNEPFLDFLVELNWSSGKLVREYTFLLNPSKTQIQAATANNVNAKNNNFHENFQNSFGDTIDSEIETQNQNQNVAKTPLEQARQNLNIKYQRQVRKRNGNQSQNPNQNLNTNRQNPNSYLVKNGDTLRAIAERIQRNNPNVTLEQMLFAIYQNNPDAFVSNDINQLKSGVNLQIPTTSQISQMISVNDAKKSYQQQTAIWANYRRKIANQTATINTNNLKNNKANASQSVQGKITPEIAEPRPQNIANQQDKLKISTTENANLKNQTQTNNNKNNQFDDLQRQINELKTRADNAELDRLAKAQALQESESRVKELEKNVADLSNLLEIKNQQLANLEKISNPENATSTAPAMPIPAENIIPEESPKSEIKPTKTLKHNETGDEIFDKGDEKDSEKGGIINKNLGTIGGSLMILSLLGASIAFLRKKKKKLEEQHNEAENNPEAIPPNVDNDAEKNNENLVENVPENIENETDEQSNFLDPLQEAQNYIDANQYDKAEEILLNAFNQDTTNTAFMAKLLEIYAHQANTERFENIARQLQNIVGNDSEDWQQTKILGHQIDPTNPLYMDEIAEDNPADDLLNSLDDVDGFTEPKMESTPIIPESSEQKMELELEPEPEISKETTESESDDFDDDDDEPKEPRKPVEEVYLKSSIDAAVLNDGPVRTDIALDYDSLDTEEDNDNKEKSETDNLDDDEHLLDELSDLEMDEELEAIPPDENTEIHENSENNFDEVAETETESIADEEIPEISKDNEISETNEISEDVTEDVAEIPADTEIENNEHSDVEIPEISETDEIIEEIEDSENSENIENIEDSENSKNIENIEDSENIENVESEEIPENPEEIIAEESETALTETEEQNTEELEEAEETEDIEELEEEFEELPLNETETKFELAKAYEEMGDIEGARDLWNELVNSTEASPEIIIQAREHLRNLPEPDGQLQDDLSKLL